MKQPIKNTYPPDLTVGTNMVSVNTNIIEHQHVPGVKSPPLRIIENTKQVQDGKFLNTSTTAQKFSLSYSSRSSLLVQLKKFNLS